MPNKIILICIILLTILIVLFLMYTYKPYKTKPFQQNILISSTLENLKSSKESDTLINASSLVCVKYFHSGNLKVKLSNPFNIKHPSCSGMKDEDITVPVFAYLLHHEKYGYFLIDSGTDSSYVNNPYGGMKGLLVQKVMPKTELESNQAIEKQLPKDVLEQINAVFFTHLHFDHTAGLTALPKSIPYIAAKGERSYFIKGILETNHFNSNDIIYTIDFDSDYAENFPVGKSVDLFGDGTVWAISTHGHSKGHISYLINSKEGPIFIAGDLATLNKCIELGVGSGTSSLDINKAQKSLENAMLFLKQNTDVKVWCGHDFPK